MLNSKDEGGEDADEVAHRLFSPSIYLFYFHEERMRLLVLTLSAASVFLHDEIQVYGFLPTTRIATIDVSGRQTTRHFEKPFRL